jgi:hypothetical protein
MTNRSGALHMSRMTPLSTRTRPPSSSGALVPLRDVLDRFAGRVGASGLRPARAPRSAPSPHDVPDRDLAVRTGYACASDDLVGATPQSPSFLAAPPVFVRPGDPMPPGCDCVLPIDAVEEFGGTASATASAYPGEGVRRRGDEARAGEPVPAAFTAGASSLAALTALAAAYGLTLREDDVMQLREGAPGPGIALTGCFEIEPTETGFRIPARLPSLVPFLCGVLLPLGDRASPAPPAPHCRPLSRRIVSTVGVADLVLLRETAGYFEPLATGVVPLSALVRATHRAVLPPESEGSAEGAHIEAFPL